MKPNQIKSVFGLHTISSFKDNAIETNAFEMDIKTIVTHPDYRCESAKDDIGKFFFLLISNSQPFQTLSIASSVQDHRFYRLGSTSMYSIH